MLCQLPQEACLAWRGGGWPGEIAGGSGDGSVLALFRSPQRPRWAFRVSENVDGCGGLHSGGGVVFIRGAGVGDFPVGASGVCRLALGGGRILMRLFVRARLSLGGIPAHLSKYPRAL